MTAATDPAGILRDVFTGIQQLCAVDSYKTLERVFKENDRVNEENRRLNEAHKLSAIHLAQSFEEKYKLESCVEKLKKELAAFAAAQKQELAASAAVQEKLGETSNQLQESRKEIKNLMKDKENMHKEVNDLKSTVQSQELDIKEKDAGIAELKETQESLQRKTEVQGAELRKLKGFSLRMGDGTVESCVEKCQNMWKAAFTLIDTFFNRDLENSVLADARTWEALELHNSTNPSIPIPASNSPVAKQMRVAALLKVFGLALYDHIFLTTYVLEEDDNLAEFMGDLARQNSAQETYLRGVILSSLPEQQIHNAKKKINKVVDEVMDYAEPLLPPTRVEQLRNMLTKSCQEICEQWMELQKMDGKVEASLKPSRRVEEWEALQRVPAGDTAATEKKLNGIVKMNGKDHNQPSRRPRVDPRNIYCTLWPSMIMVNEDREDVLSKGVVLLATQWQEAKDEEASLPELKFSGPNRRRRASARAANGVKPNVSKDFLSNGDTGSSKGS